MHYLRTLTSCTATLAMLFSSVASAQGTADNFPSRAVSMVVPYASGGPIDLITRNYTTKASALLGQPLVVDNKPGAATTIGTAYVAKAAPDGYTIMAVAGSFTTIPALYRNLSFDVVKDFAHITQMSQQPFILMASLSFPAKSIAEFVAYAKANPGKINWGTSGAGGAGHLIGAWINSATNTNVTFVHYKGTAAVALEVMTGRLDIGPDIITFALPRIKSGKVRALATTQDKRSRLLPDVPTVEEQGIPGYNYTNWMGFVAPGATPAAIVNRLNNAFVRVVKSPEVIMALEADGGVAVGSTPAEFRQFVVKDVLQWQKVVKETGIKLDG